MDPFNADEEPTSRKAEFARFHGDNYPTLVALLHALDGERAHAHKVAQRALTHAWRRWDTVRALPDPAAWTRRRARQAAPPRRKRATDGQNRSPNDTEWIAPVALPTFEALAALPSEQRTVLALHHVAGLDQARIAEEEGLTPDVVGTGLAQAYEALAAQLGHHQPDTGAVHTWAARQLDDLTHALSYGSDRRATEQVFHRAIRQRLTVATAAAAALSIVGVGGTFAVVQYQAGAPRAVLPPSGGPGAMLMPPPDVERAPDAPLLPPGAPAPAGSRPAVTPDADVVPSLGAPEREPDSTDGDTNRSDDDSDSDGSSHHPDRSSDRFSVPRPVAAAPRSAATPNATQAQPNANQPSAPAQGVQQQPATQPTPRAAQNSGTQNSGTQNRDTSSRSEERGSSPSRSDRNSNSNTEGRSDNGNRGSSWGSNRGGGNNGGGDHGGGRSQSHSNNGGGGNNGGGHGGGGGGGGGGGHGGGGGFGGH
ncbi:sigma-70 family RNA polymerase sigma factor [Pseudonocardia spinosispora]|uniref:sigma-70 family RNA polymerase sigma factor n=1 Tax=Pseudonocardia spinosispora TaxID=103441 RepID=UPI001B7F84ED|nr:sigma-70 family RNA polymerase sigma factor [Pseudonocardia spinosispora]